LTTVRTSGTGASAAAGVNGGGVFRQSFAGVCIVLVALANALVSGVVMAAPGISQEYEVKAAFLFNFAKFVAWPTAAFKDTQEPLRLCVLGHDPFGQSLKSLVAGETINQRPIVIVDARDTDRITDCHMLFISRSEQQRILEILDGIGASAVLTVSEVDEFASHGGNLNFFVEDSRIRFEVNPASANRQGLRLSAQLVKLGRLVDDRGRGDRTGQP
jgi:hypothetical protein